MNQLNKRTALFLAVSSAAAHLHFTIAESVADANIDELKDRDNINKLISALEGAVDLLREKHLVDPTDWPVRDSATYAVTRKLLKLSN